MIGKMQRLLTPEEICELLGIEKSTLYAWTSRHLIPFLKINGILRFRENEITEWLKTKERGDIINRMVEEIIRS